MPKNNESNCGSVRARLGPDVGPRESTPDLQDAHAHLEQCADCQEFYAQQRGIAQRLRGMSLALDVPSHLKDSVLAAISLEEQQTSRRKAFRLSPLPTVSGLVAAAAGLAIWIAVRAPGEPEDPIGPPVAIAMRSAPTNDSMRTTESLPLQEWFRSHSIPVFEIPVIEDAQLTGGRVIRLAGYNSAAVDFIKDGRQLTYVMAPVTEWLEELTAEEIRSISSDGFEVALWEEDGTARAVMSSMPKPQLLEIAEQCKYKRIL